MLGQIVASSWCSTAPAWNDTTKIELIPFETVVFVAKKTDFYCTIIHEDEVYEIRTEHIHLVKRKSDMYTMESYEAHRAAERARVIAEHTEQVKQTLKKIDKTFAKIR